ncbi:unnamed protein product [Blepharisma stoltei]|uniref:Uncharacterized protein n=1 Tax=Blepharisma stoltei TaxID=1481888 RepID=A0AAU9IBB1_9CILI|nr:unnamed protein product [Blepharisma stoltei]
MEIIEFPLEVGTLYLQILKLDECAYVYIGKDECPFNNLIMGIQTKYNPLPNIVHIMGFEESWTYFIQKICKKINMQVVFSINIEGVNPEMIPIIEEAIIKTLS